ncbi:MAG TPA: polysaccharide deacetylase family protein [Longimicrobiales bacterium]
MRPPGVRRARMWLRRSRARRSPGAVILGYHSISAPDDDPHALCVAPARFEEHLEVLAAHARPVSLAGLARALRDGALPERAVAITFDDGYADCLHAALPRLERFDVPATAFVTTGFLGQEFRWDAQARLRQPGGGPAAPPTRRALTPAELQRLAASGLVEIGAHSVTHPRLAEIPRDAQRREIRGSRDTLEALTGRRVTSFSYPHGSAARATVAAVREAGFERACGSVFDAARPRHDPWRLPRLWPRDVDGETFARWLASWMPRG